MQGRNIGRKGNKKWNVGERKCKNQKGQVGTVGRFEFVKKKGKYEERQKEREIEIQ